MHVVGARGASGFALPVGIEAFEESGRSLVRGTLDYLQGLKVRVFASIQSFLLSSPCKNKSKIEALSCLFCKLA